MKFIEKFGRLVGSIFLFFSIVINIMCLIAGYTPIGVRYCIVMCLTIAIIADCASLTATKIMREERKSFKEIIDKAFKIDEEKKDVNAKDTN